MNHVGCQGAGYGLFKIEQKIFIRTAPAFDQYHVTVYAQAAGSGNTPCRVQRTIKIRLRLQPGIFLDKGHDVGLFLRQQRQRTFFIHSNAAMPFTHTGPTVQKCFPIAQRHGVEQVAYHTLGRFAFQPPALACHQGCRITVQADLAQPHGVTPG